MAKLRYKKLASGKFSIYIETYIPETQKRKYHFLKLYVSNDYSKVAKIEAHDIPTMKQAQLVVNQPKGNNNNETKKLSQLDDNEPPSAQLLLSSYISATSKASMSNKKALLSHISSYPEGKSISLQEINKNWIFKFEQHLASKGLSEVTTNSYLKMLATTFNQAVKEKHITTSPLSEWTQKRTSRKKVEYLTEQELKMLIDTPIPFEEQIKDAFLFSCYSGLRHKDLQTLTVEQVTENLTHTKYYLLLKYTNSETNYHLELETQAKAILQKYITNENQVIFDKMALSRHSILLKLKIWAAHAGIDKEINFSMARDTFAYNQLLSGETQDSLAIKMGVKSKKHLECYIEIIN